MQHSESRNALTVSAYAVKTFYCLAIPVIERPYSKKLTLLYTFKFRCELSYGKCFSRSLIETLTFSNFYLLSVKPACMGTFSSSST